MDFERWYAIFYDTVRSNGFHGTLDKWSFRDAWAGKDDPEDFAVWFVNEMD